MLSEDLDSITFRLHALRLDGAPTKCVKFFDAIKKFPPPPNGSWSNDEWLNKFFVNELDDHVKDLNAFNTAYKINKSVIFSSRFDMISQKSDKLRSIMRTKGNSFIKKLKQRYSHHLSDLKGILFMKPREVVPLNEYMNLVSGINSIRLEAENTHVSHTRSFRRREARRRTKAKRNSDNV